MIHKKKKTETKELMSKNCFRKVAGFLDFYLQTIFVIVTIYVQIIFTYLSQANAMLAFYLGIYLIARILNQH